MDKQAIPWKRWLDATQDKRSGQKDLNDHGRTFFSGHFCEEARGSEGEGQESIGPEMQLAEGNNFREVKG